MLDVLERKASSDIAPLSATAVNRRQVPGGPYVAYNIMTLGFALGTALRAAKDSEYNALSDATSAINLDVLGIFRSAFYAETARLGIKAHPVADPDVASRLRSDDFKQLPPTLDGVVDVQIYNVGYYDLGKGRGFTPYVNIYGRVLDLINAGETAEDWSCDAPAEPDDSASRELLFPPDLTIPALESFGTSTDRIKAEFTRVLEACGRRLAADVVRFQQLKMQAAR
jgi:hypothetical protein